MDYQDLKRVVREQYPFPIAYAHKKTLGVLDDNVEKLKCLVETAEATIQFLALLALAQVRQNLLNPPQNHLKREKHPPTPPSRGDYSSLAPPRRGIDLNKLREEITLTNPTFGKWNRLAREVMKAYCDAKDQLIVPEMFDLFWRWDSSGQKLRTQRLDNKVIGPLITLRNDFHHGRVPDSKVQEKVAEGLTWLHQLLEAIQFLAQYQLSFTQQIVVDDAQQRTYYVHDLTLLDGCVSVFDRSRWRSEIRLKSGSVILLHSREGRHLILNPFLIFTNQIKGVADLCILNTVVHKKAVYVSCQFGEELSTKDDKWADGPLHHEALSEFFDLLQSVPHTSSFAPALPGEESSLSTAKVFQQKYREPEPIVQHTSPYKFLDYYNPEDHDIFFGRDREIRLLQQKFYNSRLLVLHGESGTGKTSLIRAGLIPRLDPESYIPVYVRILKDPLHEIKRELMHQLGIKDERYSPLEGGRGVLSPVRPLSTREGPGVDSPLEGGVGGCSSPLEGSQGGVIPLAEFLSHITERVSKTVVIVLDQFEEFFLRFPEEVRQQFAAELAACIDTPRLDVKFLIALRSDYFASLAAFESSIPQIFTHQLQLERLTEAQSLEAVIKPPEQLGTQVDEAMVQIKLLPELVSEEGIEPPLLQIVCDALYQNAQSEGRSEIGMTDYEAIGDVKGCLGRYLDTKLRQFGKNQPIARAVLKALVTAEGTKRASFAQELLSRIKSMSPGSIPGNAGVSPAFPSREGLGVGSPLEGGRGVLFPSREGLGVGSSPGSADILSATDAGETPALPGETLKTDYLDKFVRDRLVRVEEVEGRAHYELSHDYLVKHIEAWIEESEREVTKVLEVIDRAYEAYQSTDLLLESSALQMIKPFEDQLVLPADKQAFVDRSKTQVRKKRRGLLLKVGVALLSMALVLGGIFGYQKYQDYQALKYQKEQAESARQDAEQQAQLAQEARMKAERQTRIAQARRLVTEARTALEKYPQRSLLLAIEALNVILQKGELHIPAAEEVLWQTLENIGGVALSGDVMNLSPDGSWLAIGSDYGVVRLWDLTHSDLTIAPVILRGHVGKIQHIVFSPNSRWLSTYSGEDGTLCLWDLTAADLIATSPILKKDERLAYWSSGLDPIVFSPDSRWFVTNPGSFLYVRDLSAPDPEETLIELRGHKDLIFDIAFSPNGRWLVTGSWDTTARLWDLKATNSTETSIVLRGHKYGISTVAISPNGYWLATCDWIGSARLWDMTTPDPATASVLLGSHKDSISQVAFSPDNRWLVTKGGGTAWLWSLAESDPAAAPIVLQGTERTYGTYGTSGYMAFNPDGHWFIIGSNLYNLTASDPTTPAMVLHGHTDSVSTGAFSPDGHWLATGSQDHTVILWDLTASNQATAPIVLRGHDGPVSQVMFTSDTHWLVTRGVNGPARLWDLTSLEPAAAPIILRGNMEPIRNAIFSPNNRWFITNKDGDDAVQLWDLTAAHPAVNPVELQGNASVVNLYDRWLVTLGMDNQIVRLWDLTAVNPIASPRILVGAEEELSYQYFVSQNERWMGNIHTARLWDLSMPDPTAAPMIITGSNDVIRTWAFSPDNSWLATGSNDGTIRLWNLTLPDRPILPVVLHRYKEEIWYMAISPDNHWLATSDQDGTVRLWDLAVSEQISPVVLLQDQFGQFYNVAISPDSHWLITYSGVPPAPIRVGAIEADETEASARLWDLTVADPSTTALSLRGPAGGSRRWVFSPDGHWLVATRYGENTIQSWDLRASEPGAQWLTLHGHNNDIEIMEFSPDSRWLATVGQYENTVRLWDMTAVDPAAAVVVLRGHTGAISAVAFSPDGHWLGTGSADGTARLWTLRLDELVTLACRTAGRNLSLTEWEQYFPGEAYRSSCPGIPMHSSVIDKARSLAATGNITDALAIFQSAAQQDPDSAIDPRQEADKWAAQGLIEKGNQLAEKGKIQEAIAAYTEAQTLNPNLRDIDPIAEAHRVAASELFQKGSQLATEGKIQEAVAAYEEAKALDPKRSDLDPAMEAHKWVAQGLLQKAKRSAQNGKIQDAIAAFEEAKTLDLTLKRSVQTWAMLCWYGSLEGYAAEVLHACEQAVVLAPENGRSRDLRGLARALTDNITGAIEDFQAFVEWTYDEEDKALVKGWIEALREGENPFTDEVLKELRGGITTGIGFTRDF